MSRTLIAIAVVAWAAMGLVGGSQVRAWSRFHPGWKLPVTYALSTPSNDLGEEKSEAIVAQAVADWMNVRCTSLRTEYLGRTDRSPGARDGANVFGWVHDDWTNGAGVIGTTSYRSTSQGSESDIAFNGQDYRWTTGPGRSRTVNAYSIVAHELGHFFGPRSLRGARHRHVRLVRRRNPLARGRRRERNLRALSRRKDGLPRSLLSDPVRLFVRPLRARSGDATAPASACMRGLSHACGLRKCGRLLPALPRPADVLREILRDG